MRNAIIRFEVFTAVTMKNGVFCDVTPCGFLQELHGITSQKAPFFRNAVVSFVKCHELVAAYYYSN
jgi:hypothetical protein